MSNILFGGLRVLNSSDFSTLCAWDLLQANPCSLNGPSKINGKKKSSVHFLELNNVSENQSCQGFIQNGFI